MKQVATRCVELFFFLLLATTACAQGGGQAVNVTIQNPSFEQASGPFQPNNPCGLASRQAGATVTGWTFAYNSMAFQPNAGSNPCGNPPSPDGSATVGYIQDSMIVQDTGVKPSDLQQPGRGESTGFYVLNFWVTNFFSVYPGYYEAQILIGTIDPVVHVPIGHELCSIDGWAIQHWLQIPLMCPSPDYLLGYWPDNNPGPADPNAHIVLSFSNTLGWSLIFDTVSLTFTPKP